MGDFFRRVWNTFAWSWNHLLGVLFLVGGVWAFFAGGGVVVALCGIGVGVYFLISRDTEKFIGSLIDGLGNKAADKIAEGVEHVTVGGEAWDGRAPSTAELASAAGRRARRRRLQVVLLVVMIVALLYGLSGLRNVGEVTMYIHPGGEVTSTSEGGNPLAWISLLVALACGFVLQGTVRREQREKTEESNAAPAAPSDAAAVGTPAEVAESTARPVVGHVLAPTPEPVAESADELEPEPAVAPAELVEPTVEPEFEQRSALRGSASRRNLIVAGAAVVIVVAVIAFAARPAPRTEASEADVAVPAATASDSGASPAADDSQQSAAADSQQTSDGEPLKLADFLATAQGGQDYSVTVKYDSATSAVKGSMAFQVTSGDLHGRYVVDVDDVGSFRVGESDVSKDEFFQAILQNSDPDGHIQYNSNEVTFAELDRGE